MLKISLLHPDLLSKLLTVADLAAKLPPEWRQNFIDKIRVNGECWEWTGARVVGYGHFAPGSSHDPARKNSKVHRLSYRVTVGPILDGLMMDHLCRNKACLRPCHLQPVTARVNALRGLGPSAKNHVKTHCPRGHALVDGNLTASGVKDGRRRCLTCSRAISLVNNRVRRSQYTEADHERRRILARARWARRKALTG